MMKLSTKILFRLSFSMLMIGALTAVSVGQKIILKVVAAPKGVWVICGDRLPKGFSYILSRQKNNGDWAEVAKVAMPKSKEQLQANLLTVEQTAGLDIEPLAADRLEDVWSRVTNDAITDSPPEMQGDYALRSATGTAWYDATADSGIVYRYKVDAGYGDNKAEIFSNSIKYPVKKFTVDVKPLSVKPELDGVYGEFEIADVGQMTHCKILRSYYLRSGFEEINASPLFIKRKGVLIISFIDKTATPKVPYVYSVLPIDAAGNKGFASQGLKAFDVADKSIAPSVHQFRAYSDQKNKAIRLGWKLDDTKSVITIDIYKSTTYNGKYFKIATAAPTDTTYSDFSVKPINNYFYAIKLNGIYETSPMSPRIPAILKASYKNDFPPVNVELRQDNNKVTLTWRKLDENTRAYFVYRANGRDGIMKQVGPPIITDSIKVSFTDVLPATTKQMAYTYTVASENTSYAIGPKSMPLTAYSGGLGKLPIPYKLNIRKTEDGKLQLLWPNMRVEGQPFLGYAVLKSITTADGKISAPQILSKRLPNSVDIYVDTAMSTTGIYHYQIATVGMDSKTLSSPSPEVRYTVYEDVPPMVANIRLFPSKNGVELSWNNPVGVDLTIVEVTRLLENGSPIVIARLAANVQNYTDKDVSMGSTYYYTITVKNKKGKSSLAPDLVGIRIR